MLRIIRKTFLLLFLFTFILFGLSQSNNVFFEKKNIKASLGFPYQFGGTVLYYQPACASDPQTGICSNCQKCTSGVGNYICNYYQEIQFTPAKGSMPPNYICVPKGFPFMQGPPVQGGYILGGGASNIMIWMAAASP